MSDKQARSIGERLHLAWPLFAVTAGLTAAAIVIASLNAAQGVGEFQPIDAVWGASWLSFPAIGALIASRRPRNPVGWLADSMGLPIATLLFAGEYGTYASIVRPELPGDSFFIWLSQWPFFISGAIAVFIFLLFPSGSLPSRRWRLVGWIAALASAFGAAAASVGRVTDESIKGILQNPLLIPSLADLTENVQQWSGTVILLCVLAAVFSSFIRARRASSDERRQLKWFYSGLVFLVLSFVVIFVIEAAFALTPYVLTTILFALGVMAPPTGMAIAILRYRLYDIDVVINKTFVYFTLAAFITLIYVGVVVGIG
ncbi:MAG: hypothetical protein ACRD1T_02295, partial [Acidimicrobiia bacterium]